MARPFGEGRLRRVKRGDWRVIQAKKRALFFPKGELLFAVGLIPADTVRERERNDPEASSTRGPCSPMGADSRVPARSRRSSSSSSRAYRRVQRRNLLSCHDSKGRRRAHLRQVGVFILRLADHEWLDQVLAVNLPPLRMLQPGEEQTPADEPPPQSPTSSQKS
jgi:hypothetical protein